MRARLIVMLPNDVQNYGPANGAMRNRTDIAQQELQATNEEHQSGTKEPETQRRVPIR